MKKLNIVFPGSLSTLIFPSCLSIISFTICSPLPVKVKHLAKSQKCKLLLGFCDANLMIEF